MSENMNSKHKNNSRRELKNKRDTHNRKGRAKRVIEEVIGKVSLTREGYGFIVVPDREIDIFVSARSLRGALNNDIVRVATKGTSRGEKAEGEVLEIVERSKKPFIGILQIVEREAWVIVESKFMPYDIQVPMDQAPIEAQGQKVAVLVKEWTRGATNPFGEIVDILGEPGDNNTEMHAILAEFGLPYKFADGVESAAGDIPTAIEPEEIKKRRDFRRVLTVTIDPVDAKDFDDAISYKVLKNGNLEIGVHIADVTHYVKPKDIVDREAVERGTSVYLVDRTVPMLPEILSNNLCSLRPNEEKLTFSAVFEVDNNANIVDEWYGRTVIKSCRRYAYEQVQKMIESDGKYTLEYLDAKGKVVKPAQMRSLLDSREVEITDVKKRGIRFTDKEVSEAVMKLHNIASTLRARRFNSGSISFERPEMKILVDESGKPVDIIQKITKEANWLVEEFMLLANKGVATYVTKKMAIKEPTFIYRVHDEPNYDKIQNLRDFVKHFGYKMGATPNAKTAAIEINKLLDKVKGTPQSSAIEIIALRSMARAKYTTDNVGHYGLAFDFYSHFTSPIRRYPDMMVHRLLAHYLDKGKSADKGRYEDLCKHCSTREQIATDAERSSIKYKLTEYMQDKVGNEYEGTISGVTEWGIYVEIEPSHAEGMVMLREIKEDFFIYDEKNYCIIGKSSRVRLTLGDKVRIKVTRANLEQKLIDFSLIWDYEKWGKSSRPERRERGESEVGNSRRRSERSEKGERSERFGERTGEAKRGDKPERQEGSRRDKAKKRDAELTSEGVKREYKKRKTTTSEEGESKKRVSRTKKNKEREEIEREVERVVNNSYESSYAEDSRQEDGENNGKIPFYAAIAGKAKSAAKKVGKGVKKAVGRGVKKAVGRGVKKSNKKVK